jgi:hypothetical protein
MLQVSPQMGLLKIKKGSSSGKLIVQLQKAWIEVDPLGQTLPLGTGGTSLSKVEGKMEVNANIDDWTKFTFSGEMTGFTGMESNVRKTFTINGSITAENEGLGVKNISASFAGMNITYDVQNARLTGDLEIINRRVMHIKGPLTCGRNWMVYAHRRAGYSTGLGTMAGILTGDYHQMVLMTQILMQYAYIKRPVVTQPVFPDFSSQAERCAHH